jgi:hypothetical protein
MAAVFAPHQLSRIYIAIAMLGNAQRDAFS